MQELVIHRTLNAPLKLVWKAWTEKEHLAQWWGPKGFKMEHISLELKPGGIFHYGMSSPEGDPMWGKFVFKEIDAPSKLVFIVSFSDENASTVRAPFSKNWPLEVENTLTLEEENGQTKLTLRGGPINATEEEFKMYESMMASMNAGFNGTFEQLEEHLKEMN